MYQAFDNFLAVDTWHTTHPLDEKRFFRALDRIVRESAFNADAMASYMREKVGISPNEEKDDSRAEAIDRYTSAAWAVRGYLDATSER